MREKDCIEWSRSRDRNGYGKVRIKGKPMLAHRLSWILNKGYIPKGMLVCHKCDNPPCYNPDHLFIGTCADNMRDAREKGIFKAWGQRLKGAGNHKAKLTEEQVAEIRKMIACGIRVVDISKKFGVGWVTISDIKQGITWRDSK